MKYQVPQFIEVESKIFGPLTLKQFIYLVGGAGLAFIVYVFFPLWLAIPFEIPIVSLAAMLAFYKVNNQPFVKFAENAIKHFINARLYVWKKSPQEQSVKEAEKVGVPPPAYVPKLTQSRLRELAWSLDIKDKNNTADDIN